MEFLQWNFRFARLQILTFESRQAVLINIR